MKGKNWGGEEVRRKSAEQRRTSIFRREEKQRGVDALQKQKKTVRKELRGETLGTQHLSSGDHKRGRKNAQRPETSWAGKKRDSRGLMTLSRA